MKTYQWDWFSFQYPSDGNITTTTHDKRIVNFVPNDMEPWLSIGKYLISIYSTNQYNTCLSFMGLNSNGQPIEDEWYSTLKSTTTKNWATVYDSIPWWWWESVAQSQLCIQRLNKPLSIISYGANNVDIDTMIKNSLIIN